MLTLKDCVEESHYSQDDFFFIKPRGQVKENRKSQAKVFNEDMDDFFEAAFKPATASKEDINFMKEVFCFPVEACNRARLTLEDISSSLKANNIDPSEKFKELREEYIKTTFVDSIVTTAKRTLPTEDQAGTEAVRIWCGEKGCGKTTLLNYIFLTNSDLFDEKKIIWIRLSIFLKLFYDSIDVVEEKFYLHCIKIFYKAYRDKLLLDDYSTRCEIWKGRYSHNTSRKFRENLFDELESSEKIEYAKRLIKHAHNKGWAFIFVLDNIDHYEENQEIVKDIIDFSFRLSTVPVKSLVIVVARWESITDHHKYLSNTYSNFQYIEIVPKPNFSEVFSKRLNYLEKKYDNRSYIQRNYGKKVTIPKARFLDHVVQYFLTHNPIDREGYLLTDLANDNIRNVFSMMKTILFSHIEDVSSVPLYYLLSQIVSGKNLKLNDHLREHITVWSLALKNNFLFYKDDLERSWIRNLYSRNNSSDSIFLKRLVLDFFQYMKEQYNQERLTLELLQNVFVKGMKFDEKEFNTVLDWLACRKASSPLLYKMLDADSNGHSKFIYTLSRKGLTYSNYLAELFTYLELILEDLELPISHTKKGFSLNFELIPYDPLIITDKNERRKFRLDYFLRKRDQVSKLLDYFECRCYAEMFEHNDFSCVKTGFSKSYFPQMRDKVSEQVRRISLAYDIDYEPL